ncbi:MAG: S8 family serine peptidase [Gammaproteobacteria bacterium]|jgi:serine protease|nr:S8 family serine peptidase [Gammaproteobacteria bacterium]
MLRSNSLTRLVGIFLLAATFLTTAHASELRTVKQPIEGRYIVVLKDDVATLGSGNGSGFSDRGSRGVTVASVAQNMARTHGAQLRGSFSHVLPGFVVEADEDALVKLITDDRVAYVEEDGIVSIRATQNNATWGLDRVDQRDRPLDGSYTYNTTASNVHAYVIDTGVLGSHNEFSGRMGNGYTAINDGRGWTDCNGHGTHVAGTVAGSTYGVAKGATVHAVRVLGCNGSGTNSGVIAGMDWVAANAQFPAVANMSLGGGASTSTDNAVTNMRNSGVTVVVAAGNDNSNACYSSPARSADAITVGSSTSSDSRSSFSNYGSCVDIFAPGSSITSAWYTGNSSTNTISGTSMASPHVAGIAALYLADNPGATPSQVENAIYSSGSSNKLSGIGSGSPNLLAYSLFDGDGGGGDDGGGGGGGTTELSNGVPENNLSGAQGSEADFTIDVPSGATNLEIAMSGGSGDADLYVRFGAEPTTSTYDCRPYRNGNNETCEFATPQTGTYYIMLRGYSSYSGVSLVASFDEDDGGGGGGGAPCSNCTEYTGSLSGSNDSDVQPDGTYYYAGSGTHNGWLSGPTNADFDLELYRWSGWGWNRVASSTSASSEEQISYNGSAGYYYWRVESYSGSGSYSFWLDSP